MQGGGKGPLIQKDKSATLTVAQTQTLFQPVNLYEWHNQDSRIKPTDVACILNTNAGGREGHLVLEPICIQGSMIGRKDENGPQGDGINEDKSFTLNTIDRHAVAYGICSDKSNSMLSSNPHSGIYEADTARTLDLNGGNPACNQGGICVVEPIGLDGFNQCATYDVACTITGQRPDFHHVPCVVEPAPYQKVCGSLMANTHPGSYCGQDAYNDMLITEKCYTIDDTKMGNTYVWEDQANTLTARDYKGAQVVCYSLDRASFNQGKNAQYDFQISDDGKAHTLVAKGPSAVCYKVQKYIVRRLTPTECARLQGMPDDWTTLHHIDDMSDEDYEFWLEAHRVYAEVNGKTYKKKTKQQMIDWYNKLETDGAKYKAYGNGMALPCVRVPIHGIAKHGAKTMASLFDGIGGFPLAGLLDGIETKWTSEIELFPIAVTRERFKGVW